MASPILNIFNGHHLKWSAQGHNDLCKGRPTSDSLSTTADFERTPSEKTHLKVVKKVVVIYEMEGESIA